MANKKGINVESIKTPSEQIAESKVKKLAEAFRNGRRSKYINYIVEHASQSISPKTLYSSFKKIESIEDDYELVDAICFKSSFEVLICFIEWFNQASEDELDKNNKLSKKQLKQREYNKKYYEKNKEALKEKRETKKLKAQITEDEQQEKVKEAQEFKEAQKEEVREAQEIKEVQQEETKIDLNNIKDNQNYSYYLKAVKKSSEKTFLKNTYITLTNPILFKAQKSSHVSKSEYKELKKERKKIIDTKEAFF